MNDSVTRGSYSPDADESLSLEILQTIEAHTGQDMAMTDFHLYDDIDPDAIESLFQSDASSKTKLQFTTDGVSVMLWGDGDVEIRVTAREDRE